VLAQVVLATNGTPIPSGYDVVLTYPFSGVFGSGQAGGFFTQVAPPFPDQAALYDHIRKAPTRKREVGKEAGSVEDAGFSVPSIIRWIAQR